MKKIQFTTLLLLLLLLLQPSSTLALSCAEIPNIEDGYARYDGVIVGKVDKVTRHGENNKVKVTVSKSYKGIDVNKVMLIENSTWGATMGPSTVGEEYLFFLRQEKGQWENPLCSPTVKLADASGMIEFLKDKEIPISHVEENSTGWSTLAVTTVLVVCIFVYGYIRMRRK